MGDAMRNRAAIPEGTYTLIYTALEDARDTFDHTGDSISAQQCEEALVAFVHWIEREAREVVHPHG